jgi:hypothetical protein
MRSLLLLSLALLPAACDSPDGSGGTVGEVCAAAGFVCDTPTCSQFPTMTGCDYVLPSNAHCPFEKPHCFDPTKTTGYCNPTGGICTKPKGACMQKLCTADDVKTCYDTNDRLFCKDGYSCTPFGCMDGGIPDGGGDDLGAPGDAAPPAG